MLHRPHGRLSRHGERALGDGVGVAAKRRQRDPRAGEGHWWLPERGPGDRRCAGRGIRRGDSPHPGWARLRGQLGEPVHGDERTADHTGGLRRHPGRDHPRRADRAGGQAQDPGRGAPGRPDGTLRRRRDVPVRDRCPGVAGDEGGRARHRRGQGR